MHRNVDSPSSGSMVPRVGKRDNNPLAKLRLALHAGDLDMTGPEESTEALVGDTKCHCYGRPGGVGEVFGLRT